MRHTFQRFRVVLAGLPLVLVMVQCQDDAASSDQLGAHAGHAKHGDADASGADSDAETHRDASASADAGAETPAHSGQAAAGTSAPPPDDGKPTWSGIFNHALRACKDPNCHGGGLAGIDMTTQQNAYDSLVGHASDPTRPCAKLNLKRVEPGKPDESLLYLKLDINAPCGQQMPPGGSLSQAARDRVRDWIAQGAKND